MKALATNPDDARRRSASRVPLTPPSNLFARLMLWYSRRAYGDVLDNGLALLHNRPVLMATVLHERRVARWHRLEENLKTLAVMATAGAMGCSWCMDFGYYQSLGAGLDPAKLREVPRWRESSMFTTTERTVMQYAEAMSAMPPEVDDELAATLRAELGDAAFVELTAMVALENQRSRFNSALGLVSQGFSDRCELAR